MPNQRIIRKAFTGGEISRELLGLFDLAEVQNGVDTCRNFIVQPHGSLRNRPGTQFVCEIKDSNQPARLIPFSFSNTQTYAVEMGAGYFRFCTQSAQLIDTTLLPYEIANSYDSSSLFDIHYVQSGDVVTMVHPLFPPSELSRFAALNWTFSPIVFGSKTTAPAAPVAAATYPTAGVDKTFKYVVTALNSLGYEESVASPASNIVTNDLTISGNFNTITWTAVPEAIRYNVYKYAGGTYGYIAQVNATSFVDDNVIADLTRTIPITDVFFASPGNYPAAVCYHEQRRFFAGSLNEPQNVWATQSGSQSNMAYSIPTQASDALRFKIAAQSANSVKHLVPALDLMAMTASTEWRIYSASNDALSPTSLTVKPQAQNGSSNVQPAIVNNYILYAQAQGGHIREISYQWQSSGYKSEDLCYLSNHLFNNKVVKELAFSRAPTPILWVLMTTGELYGITYDPQQQVHGWHKHDTINGVVESICTVAENNEDVLYLIIKRTIDGTVKRYIESLHDRAFGDDLKEAFVVDCGLTYRGAPVSTISNLDHLEKQTVSILADGGIMAPRQVINGQITLDQPASIVHVGLPITADIVTTPVMLSGDASLGQSRVKGINKAYLRVYKSCEFFIGPSFTRMVPIKVRSYEPYGSPPALRSGEVSEVIPDQFSQDGSLYIRQSNPLPTTIVMLTLDVNIGG